MVDQDPHDYTNIDFNFESEIVSEGYNYWLSKIQNRYLPKRMDIRPAEIPRLLPHTLLVDVIRTPEWDFSYRLIGTKIVEHLHRDHTGMRMSEIEHQRPPSTIWDNCRTVAETAKPLFPQTPYVGPHEGFRRAEDILLPLVDENQTVDTLLVFVDYLQRV